MLRLASSLRQKFWHCGVIIHSDDAELLLLMSIMILIKAPCIARIICVWLMFIHKRNQSVQLNPTSKYSSKWHYVFMYKIAASYDLHGFECENLFRIIRNNLFNFEFVWMRDLRGCALNWWGIIWLGLNWEKCRVGRFYIDAALLR